MTDKCKHRTKAIMYDKTLMTKTTADYKNKFL